MVVIDWRDFGERVARYRKRFRLTQKEAADLIGISRNYLSQIERGEADVSYTIVATICVRLSQKFPTVRLE